MVPTSQSERGNNAEERLGSLEKKIDKLIAQYTRDDGEEEFGLHELWAIVWQGKSIIVIVSLVFAAIFVSYSISLPNVYKSEALLTPAEENSGGGLASLAGQFGGLASLAGVNLDNEGISKTDLAVEILKSRAFVVHFIKKYDLLIPLMAATGWDQEVDELIIDPEIYDRTTKTWMRKSPPFRTPEPSMQEAYDAFMDIVNIAHDRKTSFILLSVEYYSPSIAKQWVDFLVMEINSVIRERDVKEAERSIEYLKKQIEKTPVADMQAVFYELIEKQTKVVMFAEVRDEYVFKTVDEAVIPERKSKPRRSLICIVGVLLGAMLSVIFIFVRYFLRRSKLQ